MLQSMDKKGLTVMMVIVIIIIMLITLKSCDFPEGSGVVEVTVTFKDLTTVYGDDLAKAEWIIEGDVLDGDEVVVKPDEFHFKEFGEYEISGTAEVEATTDTVYKIVVVSGKYTIEKRPITIIVHDKESFVGEPLEPLSGTIEGNVINGDDLGLTYYTDAEDIPGEYKITASIQNVNYHAIINDGTYVIKPVPGELPQETARPSTPHPTPTFVPTPTYTPEAKTEKITVIFSDLTSVYGEPLAKAKWEIIGNIEEGDVISVSAYAFDFSNVGEYVIAGTVELHQSSNTNYEIIMINGTYSITPKLLTVRVDNKQSIEGRPLKTLTGTVEGGVLEGDNLGLTYHKEPGLAPGRYEITATITNPNYRIHVIKGIYVIKPDYSDDSGDNGGGGDSGQTPSDPGAPGIPIDPTEPGNPGEGGDSGQTPDGPGTPGIPTDPTESDNPEGGNSGQTPDGPGTPGIPGMPTDPTEPDNPGEGGDSGQTPGT